MADTARKLKTATLLPIMVPAPKRTASQPKALFPVRPRVAVTCPHCWKEQRANRNTCWRCGAAFIYESEQT